MDDSLLACWYELQANGDDRRIFPSDRFNSCTCPIRGGGVASFYDHVLTHGVVSLHLTPGNATEEKKGRTHTKHSSRWYSCQAVYMANENNIPLLFPHALAQTLV